MSGTNPLFSMPAAARRSSSFPDRAPPVTTQRASGDPRGDPRPEVGREPRERVLVRQVIGAAEEEHRPPSRGRRLLTAARGPRRSRDARTPHADVDARERRLQVRRILPAERDDARVPGIDLLDVAHRARIRAQVASGSHAGLVVHEHRRQPVEFGDASSEARELDLRRVEPRPRARRLDRAPKRDRGRSWRRGTDRAA